MQSTKPKQLPDHFVCLTIYKNSFTIKNFCLPFAFLMVFPPGPHEKAYFSFKEAPFR